MRADATFDSGDPVMLPHDPKNLISFSRGAVSALSKIYAKFPGEPSMNQLQKRINKKMYIDASPPLSEDDYQSLLVNQVYCPRI